MIASSAIAANPLAALLDIFSGTSPVTLIVEDGTGLSNANAFHSLQAMKDYFASQVRAIPSTLDENIERRIIAAGIILTYRYKWCGKKTVSDQALSWPRTGACNQDGETIESNIVPDYVKKASMELAYWLLVNTGKTGFESEQDDQTLQYDEVDIFEGIRVKYRGGRSFKPLPTLIGEFVAPCGKLVGNSSTYFIERS